MRRGAEGGLCRGRAALQAGQGRGLRSPGGTRGPAPRPPSPLNLPRAADQPHNSQASPLA